MTGPAAEAILNGMPHPAGLRTHHHDGTTLVTAGQMIVARLGVAQATVSRHLAGTGQQELPLGGEPGAPAEPGSAGQQPRKQGHRAEPERDEPVPEPERQPEPEQAAKPEPGAAAGAGLVPARAAGPLAGTRIVEGQVTSRYAGAMLLHAFSARAGAGGILAAAGAGEKDGRRFADAGLLSAVSTCFALGAATVEQFKHLTSGAAGPLAGLAAQPGLAADPVTSGVYYADDHFVPYAGAKPVGKGWNNKRGKAEKGRADTHVTAHDGRAVCFVTGEPSGLTVTLPKALAELKKAAGPGAKIMLGFDRGGAYAQVFRHCREQDTHWVTYRPAPLAVPGRLPVITTITAGGKTRTIAWAEEKVQLKDYGEARQLT